MLRIHFTTEDLTRISLADTVDPLWEVMLSQFLLHERDRPAFLRPWIDRIHADPRLIRRMRPGARLLAGLAPQGSYFPDFLTPPAAAHGLEAGLDAIRRTGSRRLRHELALLADAKRGKRRPSPGWLAHFANADPAALNHLVCAVRDYHDAAISPHTDLIRASVEADITQHAHAVVNHGSEGLFRSFEPLMRWQAPVLEVRYDVDQDLHLLGRGLRLVPSYFCHGSAVSLADPDLAPVLVYPIAPEHRWSAIVAERVGCPLADLLGPTRAAVLHTARRGGSTTDLARRLGTSPASVSRHAKVLRSAGLFTTTRDGSAVLHTLTPLGAQLLDGTS